MIYGSTDKSRFSPRCEIFSEDTAPARMLHPLNAVINAVKARRVRGKERAEQCLGAGKKYDSRFVILVVHKRDLSRPKYCVTTHYLNLTRADRGGDRIIGPLRKDRRKVWY